jgi:hypothetical protein
MTDPATGRVALYDEAPGGGEYDDPNSLRNRPLNDPVTWFANLYFHSDFNYMEVSTGPVIVGVNHAAVAVTAPPPGATVTFGWGSAFADTPLVAHGLGYAPLALVALGNNILWPGMPVQTQGDGGMRFATIYSDAAHVRLYEFASVGSSNLAATTLNYTVIVFRNPPAPTGNILIDFEPSTGALQMGLGKFNSLRRYLQVVAGGTPFGISYGGRTIDLANGAPRAFRPDGSSFEPILSSLQLALSRADMRGTDWGAIYGGAMNYNGAFGGPPGAIQVQAP